MKSSDASAAETVLVVLAPVEPDSAGAEARQRLLERLWAHGFETGPVVGAVCAVTGASGQIAALVDHAWLARQDPSVRDRFEAADLDLVELMRPTVVDIVRDEAVEPFSQDSPGGTDDASCDGPASSPPEEAFDTRESDNSSSDERSV